MIHQIENETGAQTTLGYLLEVGHEDGRARCILDVTRAHLNRHEMLHGGIAATLLDIAMGTSASLTVGPDGRTPFLTIAMNTQFIAPASLGRRVTATADITGGGRSTLFASGELRDEKDQLIATSTGVFKRVAPRQGDSK